MSVVQWLRRFTVRQRVGGAFLLLVLLSAATAPLTIANQYDLVSRLQQVTDVDARAGQLLLMAAARIASSRLNLMRYADDYTPAPTDALNDADIATQLLSEVQSLNLPPEEQNKVAAILQSLAEYVELVGQIQAAAAAEKAGLSPLLFQAYRLGSDMELQIGAIVQSSETRIAATNQAVYAEARSRLLWVAAGYLGVFFLALALAFLVERSITRPVSDLRRGAESLGQGQLESPIPIDGKDELSLLAQTFNTMAGRQRELLGQEKAQREQLQATVQAYLDRIAEAAQGNLTARLEVEGHAPDAPLTILGAHLNEMIASLQRISLQVQEAGNNLAAASSEILAATTQQASGASEQAAALVQASATIDEVRTIAQQTAQRAQGVAEMAQRTAAVSQAGQDAVDNTIASMAEARQQVEELSGDILALSAQTESIGQIVAAVNELAARSNLLALNAAVEAARAGAAGRGFGVVAGEVRSLAEQSREATGQIRAILAQVQKGVQAAAATAEQGMQKTALGVQVAGEAREAIRRLAADIRASVQAAAQIAAAAEQQATGIEQITVAMQNIQLVTTQTVASAQQSEQEAEELNALAGRLRQVVEQYEL